ncbi:MAG: hypothetical protein FJW54_07090 [Actinobacteria bacterium]|nr:hypothetical protein [Actinomycetota bacterium]
MQTLNLILTGFLALIFLLSGISKASGSDKGLSGTREVNVPDGIARVVGFFEVLLALGLVIGLYDSWFTNAIQWLSLVGVWCTMAVALILHFRAKKAATGLPAFILLTCASVALVTL